MKIKNQESLGIIKRIDDLDEFMKSHPECIAFYLLLGLTMKSQKLELFSCLIRVRNVTVVQTLVIILCQNQKLSSALLHLSFGQIKSLFSY